MSRRRELKDLKRGDVVWECVAGKNTRLVVLADARELEGGWAVDAVAPHFGGRTVYLFNGAGSGAYAPHLYDGPVYLEQPKVILEIPCCGCEGKAGLQLPVGIEPGKAFFNLAAHNIGVPEGWIVSCGGFLCADCQLPAIPRAEK